MDQQTRELIEAVTGWHVNRMQNLQTILDAPKGTDLRFQLGDGKELVIPGDSDKAKGFLMGIIIAKEQFATLPFTVNKPEEVAKASANPAVQEMADQLNGSEYGFTLSALQQQFAKERGLIVVYGASDDLIEFDGAFRDEGYVIDGGTVLVDAEGLLPANSDDLDTDEEIARYHYRKGKAKTIEALWCDEVNGGGFDWAYRTDIPHATFEVMDGDEPYCRGIVLAMADLK